MKPPPRNTIFIVDDDPDDRQIILDAFLESNFEIDYVFVEDAEQLMHTLQESDPASLPSLILLDLNLPGMLGMQALKEIKGSKTFSHIPTIILTTSTLPADLTRSYELGANCFLQKPQSFTDLIEITSCILRLWFRDAVKR
ncbi:MAG: response regulator [Gemmatimonadaceae bacterium]|nr:response regulator [Chitinophagaceae bacterium]